MTEVTYDEGMPRPELGEAEQVINIEDGKFTREQVYTFPVNEAVGGGSITVITMRIPVGTEVERGYYEVRRSLALLGYDPVVVCRAMGFHEVLDHVECDH